MTNYFIISKSIYIGVDGRGSFSLNCLLRKGVGIVGPAFSDRIVERPWAGEDRTADDVNSMWWNGRGCHRYLRRFHWSVVVRRCNVQPWCFFARMTQVAAWCRRWRSLSDDCCFEYWLSAFFVHSMWSEDFPSIQRLPGWCNSFLYMFCHWKVVGERDCKYLQGWDSLDANQCSYCTFIPIPWFCEDHLKCLLAV